MIVIHIPIEYYLNIMKYCERGIMNKSNSILKLVFESITIKITKGKNNDNGAPLAQNYIVICMDLLLQK